MKFFLNPWLYPLYSALLLWISWPPSPLTFPVFFAFIPLLFLEEWHRKHDYSHAFRYFLQIFLAMLLWNIFTTWWIWYASAEGAIMAIFFNALLMFVPWWAYSFTRRIFGDKLAFPALIIYWLAFEYVHFNWDISWPWLALGNVFSMKVNWVQWYEWTGASGGTIWILLINLLLFQGIRLQSSRKFITSGVMLLLPVIVSYILLNREQTALEILKQGTPIKTVIVQPNIDPYSEKFNGMDADEQVDRMLRLTDSLADSTTQLVVWPETALTESIVEENLFDYYGTAAVRDWTSLHPNTALLTGAGTFHFYKDGEKPSSTARFISDEISYDAYNTALLFEKGDSVEIYHKNKLVPGVEKMPYPAVFKYLEKFAIGLGGTSGSLGNDKEAKVFTFDSFKVAPVICYESIFGDFVSEYVRKDAGVLAVITNDGWWDNTPGYKQHLHYGRLRAVETRRYIIRGANTGISGIINPLGEIEKQTGWWVETALKATVYSSDKMTFFSKTGDYLGKIAGVMAILVLLSTIVKRKTRKGY